MLKKEQAALLANLKRQLDSRGITTEEFETAKKAILNKKPISGVLPIEYLRAKRFRLFGVLGLLSLGIPWEILFWGTESFASGGKTVFWHLFGWTWIGQRAPQFIHLFEYWGDATSLLLLSLALIGFLFVSTGSLLLLQRKRAGGKLLLASLVSWIITYAIYFVDSPYITIPIGATLCGIVGGASLLNKQ
jgi:hypothetical protein